MELTGKNSTDSNVKKPRPVDVLELDNDQLIKLIDRSTVLEQEDAFTLYFDEVDRECQAVLRSPGQGSAGKTFSLFRTTSKFNATATFSNVTTKMGPLVKYLVNVEMLQSSMDAMYLHPTWDSKLLAVKIELRPDIDLPVVTSAEVVTPTMLAGEEGYADYVKLKGHECDLNVADERGDNVFHYAARGRGDQPAIIQYLTANISEEDKLKLMIDQPNNQGETPLHMACLSGNPAILGKLLDLGADPSCKTRRAGSYPVHAAMLSASSECVSVLCEKHPAQLEAKDTHGNSPLHVAKDAVSMYAAMGLGCATEMVNNDNETALFTKVRANKLDLVLPLLSKEGVNPSPIGKDGNTPLHIAVQNGNLSIVKAFIVFRADINQVNDLKQSPRHLAATGNNSNSDSILYLLNRVGAKRCDAGVTQGCTQGCKADGTHNGKPPHTDTFTPEIQEIYKQMMESAMEAAEKRNLGEKVLCLDGGGIRGLILTQLLLAIEGVTNTSIKECFHWIGGTSTGGILALAIVYGKTVRYCEQLYLELKSTVFSTKHVGPFPYDNDMLEKKMKKEFGEKTKMADKPQPRFYTWLLDRVLVTGVLGNRSPCQLHLFRNFDTPGRTIPEEQEGTTASPHDQLMWKAAMATSAAPTYFPAFEDRFLDGGLMANNPTLDVLAEINEYNTGLLVTGRHSIEKLTDDVTPLRLVVSLGTGCGPVKKDLKDISIKRPRWFDWNLITNIEGCKNLLTLMSTELTQSNGLPVERSRSWCSMMGVPYFRLNPQLSSEIELDCTKDETLVDMMWQTHCYILSNTEMIKQLASVLVQE